MEDFEMQAGRELDWLIMEKVMGRASCELTEAASFENALDHVPNYSTEIAEAWKVAEKLNLSVVKVFSFWYAGVGDSIGDEIGYDSVYGFRSREAGPGADTAALAICLAALKLIK